jgi:hypothetical protein
LRFASSRQRASSLVFCATGWGVIGQILFMEKEKNVDPT